MSAKKQQPPRGWTTLWIWVALAFVVLGGAWVALISIANRNAPEAIPLEQER